METAAVWLLQMGRACLWGTLVISAVGLFCRVVPRLPASVRAWFWWLACLKLLLDLTLAAPIALPVLPAPTVALQSASRPAALPARLVSQPEPVVADNRVAPLPAIRAEAAPAQQTPRWPAFLLAAWIIGVTISLALGMRQGFALWGQLRGTFPMPLPDCDLAEIARRVGLRQAPHVLTGPQIDTPCVVGWFRPAILLPIGLSGTLSATELRLTLAHEMAHLKCGDLWLATVPMLARCLFFFHPLVWWAASEWSATREEACDALALSATSLSRADYGRLLLKFASPQAAAPALGLSPGYHCLRRRLLGLSRPQTSPRFARLLILALPLLLPWRLTAAVSPTPIQRASTATTHYTVTLLSDNDDSEVSALNDAGRVALTAQDQGYVGTLGNFDALGALPKHHASLAYGINAQGQAVGASYNLPGHGRAFTWNGQPHRIGSLPGYPYSEARGVNDSGLVAGFSETGTHDRFRAWITRAFLAQNGSLTDLGTLGGPYSAAYAVSNSGAVVGKADTETFGATHAFAYTDGVMTDLGTLGGANSVAYAINTSGQIVGTSEFNDSTQTRHAFLSADGSMHDLGTLPTTTDSIAYAINNSGSVVGVSSSSGDSSTKRATLWQNGLVTDLNTLLPHSSPWVLTEAHAINSQGQIAGEGFFQGKPRAFLLTPR